MSKKSTTLPGNITIGKNSQGTVRVALRDKNSGNVFATAELSPEDFANAVFGLAEIPCELQVREMETVGKTKVTEPRQIVADVPAACKYDKDALRAWLKENAQEPGWQINSYLGRQGSVVHTQDGRTLLNYYVFKYVDATGAVALPAQAPVAGYLVQGEQTRLWVDGPDAPNLTTICGFDPVVSITPMTSGDPVMVAAASQQPSDAS